MSFKCFLIKELLLENKYKKNNNNNNNTNSGFKPVPTNLEFTRFWIFQCSNFTDTSTSNKRKFGHQRDFYYFKNFDSKKLTQIEI
ncbi:hypothetical protein BpHYR1_043873 [Brachionus plicatilis]|uniref:Uncharacterized protein n=1 Tax=Brachionus plicatilis TaxID=10195 RepID=A0A3M7QIA4_BRAPC|nr:hypothetical protein BpHYR1_043873 [Brachionus plicatilis]